ncbi:hypothetical protein [Rhodomicrobium vannielii]|uniref:hypothetical protein n=1 Tax=Rhodomicrobium vannielii TaxID=1069 RepID=UPI0012DF4820|nr:hypothetical protein [Rhodomicrobium vannielii]
MADAKAAAENILSLALYAKFSPENVSALEGLNERIFASLAPLGGVPAAEAEVYVEPGQAILTAQINERGMPLVPSSASAVVSVVKSETPGEDLNAAVAAVIKSAFGLRDIDAAGLSRLAEQFSLKDTLVQLAALIRSGEWAFAAQILRTLLTQLAAIWQAVPAIQEAIGAEATKGILNAVTTRFIPFVGWPVLVTTILFAVAQNRERLIAALDKAGL